MKGLWIRVEAHEVASVRVAQLAEALGVKPVTALGHLVALGGQVAEQTPEGHIATIPNSMLETWGCWDGRVDRFARAVREFLQDGDGYLVDWRESMGQLIERRAKDRARKALGKSDDRPRSLGGTSVESRRDSAATVRHDTGRDGSTATTTARPTPKNAAPARAANAPDTPDTTATTFAGVMALVTERLYVPDGEPPEGWTLAREGSVLHQLHQAGKSYDEIAAAVSGLAILRDHPGRYADVVDWLHAGAKITLRALWADSGTLPMFSIATQAFWKHFNVGNVGTGEVGT